MCTTDAVRVGLCSFEDIGKFIFSSDDGTTINQTSLWTASVALNQTADPSGFWDNPEGNPSPPDDEDLSPWRSREPRYISRQANDTLNPSPYSTIAYAQPIQYQVRKTGYYCVGKFELYCLPYLAYFHCSYRTRHGNESSCPPGAYGCPVSSYIQRCRSFPQYF